jgi:hypothetical protein
LGGRWWGNYHWRDRLSIIVDIQASKMDRHVRQLAIKRLKHTEPGAGQVPAGGLKFRLNMFLCTLTSLYQSREVTVQWARGQRR